MRKFILGLILGIILVSILINLSIFPSPSLKFFSSSNHSISKSPNPSISKSSGLPIFSGDEYLDSLIIAKAQKYDLDPALFAALIKAESDFNPIDNGKDGEIGLGQLHPRYILKFLYEPEINLELAARELASWRVKYGDDMVAAYNAGHKLEYGRKHQIKVESIVQKFKSTIK